MQQEMGEFVGKDLLLGKGTVSFQAINKGTLWGHKEEGQWETRGQLGRERVCPVNEKQRAGIPKGVPAPRSSAVTDLQQRTDDVGNKVLENRTQLELQRNYVNRGS